MVNIMSAGGHASNESEGLICDSASKKNEDILGKRERDEGNILRG
jgi:hypothetical protein